jgi:hypothetical protein
MHASDENAAKLIRCDCGRDGEDLFEVIVAKHQINPGKPYRMVAWNPERRVGDFASPEDAVKFLTETMGYKVLEEV